MAFNSFDSTLSTCPCKGCKTRSVTCHSTCPSYAKYVREQKRFAIKVKIQKKKAGMGTPWNYTRYR